MPDDIWVGAPNDLREGTAARKALAQINDMKYWDDEVGIIEVDPIRWQEAQAYEAAGWVQHWQGATDDRNGEHKRGFNNYRDLPKNLGDLLEVGCGPFTQTRTILKDRIAKSITLLDPLLLQYANCVQNCTYKNGQLDGQEAKRVNARVEDMEFSDEFDTIICINVLEHVLNARKVLNNITEALRPGGLAVLGERTYDDLDISKLYDVGHPIRVKSKVIKEWANDYEEVYRNGDYFIGRKRQVAT